MSKTIQYICKTLIRAYQVFISPHIASACRFHPTCSNYALEVIEKYGAFKGSWLTIRRLMRCRPFGPHGYDPAP